MKPVTIPTRSASSSSSTSKQRSRGKDSRSKKKEIVITINPSLIYAQREIWSPQYLLWTRYAVNKPRLPNDDDINIRWADRPDNAPRTFAQYIGNHNADYFQQLTQQSDTFGTTKNLPDIIVIGGPSGSGKSTSAKILITRFVDELNLPTPFISKWYLQIDANDYTSDYNLLWIKIQKFSEQPMERVFIVKFRMVLIDNFDAIPPSSQQMMKRMLLLIGPNLRYLLICHEPKNAMIGFILSKSVIFRTKGIVERDALTVVLTLLNRLTIGYTREGILFLFQQIKPNYSLSALFDTLQQIFNKWYYLSAENCAKGLHKPLDLLTITPSQAIEPLPRCSICTLYPPCSHYTSERLNAWGLQRRDELPTTHTNPTNATNNMSSTASVYTTASTLTGGGGGGSVRSNRSNYNNNRSNKEKDNKNKEKDKDKVQLSVIVDIFNLHSNTTNSSNNNSKTNVNANNANTSNNDTSPCFEFLRFGHCSHFNTYGYCQLDHPKTIHKVIPSIHRCPQCTIPWPCQHCAYTLPKIRLTKLVEEIKARLSRLRQINVPEPSMAILRMLDNLPTWREDVQRIVQQYVYPENVTLLTQTQDWIDTGYCTDVSVYEHQMHVLQDRFGELITTEILVHNNNVNSRTGTGSRTAASSNNSNTNSTNNSGMIYRTSSSDGENFSPPMSPSTPERKRPNNTSGSNILDSIAE